MTYNAANRLTGYEKEKDGTALLNQKNRYNGEGQRIRKEETKGTESSVRNYYYQDDSLLYTMDEDEQMDTVNLVGLDGEIMFTVAAYEYDEFGNTTARIGESFDNEICYTGQVYDQSAGLYYYNARFYNPEDGRFLTQDTYRGKQTEPDTLHLYAYCANNPVNYVDPSGHKKVRYYNVNQCRTTYWLLCAIERTYGWYSTLKLGKKVAKKIINRGIKKALKLVVKDTVKSRLISHIVSDPRWFYGKFKKGFRGGGWGLIRIRYYTKKGTQKKRDEKIRKTKLVYYNPLNFKFYYSSRTAKNIPMIGN